MAFWDAGLAQARELWGRLTATQRLTLVGVTAALVAGLTALVLWAGAPEYTLLFSRLTPEDAYQVVEKLKAEGVPYRLESGGTAVFVPADRVYEVRLQLAGEGIPQGGLVGYEIFDRSSFGMTDFAQRVNYARALEGELTRTIRHMEGVQGARVHLVLPEKKLFETEAEPASASVVLQLAPGRSLTAKQVRGVVYLVSSSVEGLSPERVTVVDTRGNVLYRQEGDEPGFLAASQLEYKRAFEKDMERRVRDLLERVVGAGSAVVQVAAEFDFSRVEETAETYDPEGVAVRSEERVSETTTGPTGPAGVPGVASNVGQGATAQAGGKGGESSRETETVNYEVSKRVTRVEKGPGTLKRLSVAVAVDGTYREGENGREFVPRSDEELARLKALVEKAVGADSQRGDAVEVTSIPFQPGEVAVARAGPWWTSPELLPYARYGLILVLAVLLVFGVLKPLVRWLTRAPEAPEITEPVTVAEMEKRLEEEAEEEEVHIEEKTPTEAVRRELLKQRLLEMIRREPEVAAQLIRSWLTED
ncbi:MAG: flagellar M-ring protein FliF [Deltaproteobacteria bacterium]|nr:flagellar M-ring protein FliF [Deltaproteobacteria bacterium]